MREPASHCQNRRVNELYSDRVYGPISRDRELLTEVTKAGLLGVVENKLGSNWFAERFPAGCSECPGPTETNHQSFRSTALALIPGLGWPLRNNADLTDDDVFDLLEWVDSQMSFPERDRFHDFPRPGHWSLKFDRRRALIEFRGDVNQLLARGGTVFGLASNGHIQRLGTSEVRTAMSELRPNTGDSELDRLVEDGRERYRSRKPEDRLIALRQLWAAFDHLKTSEHGKDTKARIDTLLGHIPDEAMRAVVSADMDTMRSFGNKFRIRHTEADKIPVPDYAEDYVAARMANLLVILLAQSGRLSANQRAGDPTGVAWAPLAPSPATPAWLPPSR